MGTSRSPRAAAIAVSGPGGSRGFSPSARRAPCPEQRRRQRRSARRRRTRRPPERRCSADGIASGRCRCDPDARPPSVRARGRDRFGGRRCGFARHGRRLDPGIRTAAGVRHGAHRPNGPRGSHRAACSSARCRCPGERRSDPLWERQAGATGRSVCDLARRADQASIGSAMRPRSADAMMPPPSTTSSSL